MKETFLSFKCLKLTMFGSLSVETSLAYIVDPDQAKSDMETTGLRPQHITFKQCCGSGMVLFQIRIRLRDFRVTDC